LERCAVAAPLRRRSIDRRPDDRARRQTDDGARRDAARVHVPAAGPRSRARRVFRAVAHDAGRDAGAREFLQRVHGRAAGARRLGGKATAAVGTIAARLPTLYPNFYSPKFRVTAAALPLRAHLVSDVRQPLIVLLGAVAFVLLIACIN